MISGRSIAAWGPASWLVAMALVACATADDGPDVTDDDPKNDMVRREAGAATDDATSPTKPTGATAQADASPRSDGSVVVTGDGGATSGDGGSTAADGGPTSGGRGASTGGNCTSTNSCPSTVRDIGQVAGDQGAPTIAGVTGPRSEFLKLRLLEDNSDFFARVPLSATFTLDSPAGANFDLFVHVASDEQAANIECASVTAQSISTSSQDVVRVEWPDQAGADDGRNITVEVRYLGGACAAGQTWQLKVDGHT